ncbi:MAG: hypothetical protein KDA57_16145, partial [Planctomycetales bacterium]|nr:hypothetical protein [Planctomycetales bacterium]
IKLRFEGGVNNRSAETSVPNGQVRAAVNVDVDAAGRISRRLGYTRRATGATHSLFASVAELLAVNGNDLKAYDANLSATTVLAGVGEADISYAHVGTAVIWSNGTLIRRINVDLEDEPHALDCPSQPTLTAVANGGLTAGKYQVAVTYKSATGEESGSSVAHVVQVSDGQAIQLSNIAQHSSAAYVSVYATRCDGEELLHVRNLPNGTASYILTEQQRGKRLRTQFLEPMPPGQIIRYMHGRLFVADDAMLRWSAPLRPGLGDPEDYIGFTGRITMIEPVGDGQQAGAYISAEHVTNPDKAAVYYVAGANPDKWLSVRAYSSGAVLGSAAQVPGEIAGLKDYSGNVPVWLSQNGMFCVGLPGGVVKELSRNRFVAIANGKSAATLIRAKDGVDQMVTAVRGGSTSGAVATDAVTVTVTSNGVTT